MGMTIKIQPWKKIGSMGASAPTMGINWVRILIWMSMFMELHRKRNSNTTSRKCIKQRIYESHKCWFHREKQQWPTSASWYEIIIVAERAQERGYRVFGQRSIIHFSKVRCGMWRDKKSSDDTQFSSFYQIMNDLDPDGMITTES